MLTRERFYRRMARAFAERGFRVITFANRGSGRSRAMETRPWTPRLRDWGGRDLPAAVQHARETRPDDRLFVIGHSMGGQLVALSQAVHELEGIISVAATEAWWGHWSTPAKLGILGAFVAIPVIGRALPTVPADRLGLGPAVASSIARDWARWGRRRGYFVGAAAVRPRMHEYRGRVLAWSFADDELLGCHRAVDALHRRYVQADVTWRHVAPADVGVRRIGHFGYFREPAGPPLWERTIDWIDEL